MFFVNNFITVYINQNKYWHELKKASGGELRVFVSSPTRLVAYLLSSRLLQFPIFLFRSPKSFLFSFSRVLIFTVVDLR